MRERERVVDIGIERGGEILGLKERKRYERY